MSTRKYWIGMAVCSIAWNVSAQQPTRTAADVITAVGCVQGEGEYRGQVADGKGGLVNTGVGVANEFVLRFARTVSSETLKPIATGSGSTEVIYSLTGKLEGEVAAAKGQQIAVSGYVEVAPSDGTYKVKDLPRLNVLGWHKIADRCAIPGQRK